MSKEKERSYNILVYGIEKVGLTAPIDPITSRNYKLTFETFSSAIRFSEYDGVILYQGIFEGFKKTHTYAGSHLIHRCDKDELDKRKKETDLLLEKGGFLCFLLNSPFIDSDNGRDFQDSDLAKHHLNYRNFYRENFDNRIASLDIKSDDFRDFLKIHGAATSHFRNHNKHIDWRIVSETAGKTTGFTINRNEYFIPSLIPNNKPDVLQEYFNFLATGLTSSNNKLQKTLPGWIEEFAFSEEVSLSNEQQSLENRINEIQGRKATLKKYKSSLILSGDDLAACVSEIFLHGFGVKVDTKDELREDFKITDSEGNPTLLCEVKGTNRGVKREYVNQADSHRSRSRFHDKFPTILIVNTNIKNSRTLTEKDQEIAKEQILHAVKMNILIIRTLDLLELLKIYLDGTLPIDKLMDALISNNGWLKVKDGKIDIVQIPETQ